MSGFSFRVPRPITCSTRLPCPTSYPAGRDFFQPAHRKVFHASEYDLLGLQRDYGFTFENIFDTMLAARILGYRQVGLESAGRKVSR